MPLKCVHLHLQSYQLFFAMILHKRGGNLTLCNCAKIKCMKTDPIKQIFHFLAKVQTKIKSARTIFRYFSTIKMTSKNSFLFYSYGLLFYFFLFFIQTENIAHNMLIVIFVTVCWKVPNAPNAQN